MKYYKIGEDQETDSFKQKLTVNTEIMCRKVKKAEH